MQIQVANCQARVESIYFREFKFGGSSFGYPILPYQIIESAKQVAEAVQPYYEECIEEDTQFGFDATPLDLEFRKLGWPRLSIIAADHPALLQQFLSDNSFDAIQKLFPPDWGDTKPRYLINSVDSIRVENGMVTFEGELIDVAAEN